MSGTNGALRLIELASAHMFEALDDQVGKLQRVVSVQANETGGETPSVQAVAALKCQLDLQRLAWGSVTQPISLGRVTALATGLPRHIVVDVSALPPATVFPADRGRIVLNLLLLAADSLPTGGIIVLAGQPEDLFLRIAGPEAAWPSGLAVCLVHEEEAQAALTDGRNLQMALTALYAHAAKMRLSAVFPPTPQAEPAILRLGG